MFRCVMGFKWQVDDSQFEQETLLVREYMMLQQIVTNKNSNHIEKSNLQGSKGTYFERKAAQK